MTIPVKPVSKKRVEKWLASQLVDIPTFEMLATYKHLCEKQHEALQVAEYASRPSSLELERKSSKDYTEHDLIKDAIALHNKLIGE